MYVAGLGTLQLRWLLPAILLGRATGILIGITLGNFTATMPVQWVITQWLLLVLLGALAIRFQRPLRYFLLIGLRRGRRSARSAWRAAYRIVQRTRVKTPVSSPVE